ncbi:MAG: hypothetical protein ABL984_15440 [Pyrinomonadaceae bacterium]
MGSGTDKEEYRDLIKYVEGNLAGYAIKSEDCTTFIDGTDSVQVYSDMWASDNDRYKINNRTPIQHQRDRILYSHGVRKQAERYHVLYQGGHRVLRNYITHTMRMMQVTKSICRGLRLNQDFAEAIALGSKLGALPFIHASKGAVSEWMKRKIIKEDGKRLDYDTTSHTGSLKYSNPNHLPEHPQWIRDIKSKSLRESVEANIPFAVGKQVDEPYESGKQGYWLLTTNPYTKQSLPSSFSREMMFGIWRHSLNTPVGKDSFRHHQRVDESKLHTIEWNNVSFESIVVQYADDITWVIENLNDAHFASPSEHGIFKELLSQSNFEIPMLSNGLSRNDAGVLYTYFINDFIQHSSKLLQKQDEEFKWRLRGGEEDMAVGLSGEATNALTEIKSFLFSNVFVEQKLEYRTKMLATISDLCVDLIYENDEYLRHYIDNKATREGWKQMRVRALELLNDPVHRIQVAVNIFSELSDQEIFSFIGMESI